MDGINDLTIVFKYDNFQTSKVKGKVFYLTELALLDLTSMYGNRDEGKSSDSNLGLYSNVIAAVIWLIVEKNKISQIFFPPLMVNGDDLFF